MRIRPAAPAVQLPPALWGGQAPGARVPLIVAPFDSVASYVSAAGAGAQSGGGWAGERGPAVGRGWRGRRGAQLWLACFGKGGAGPGASPRGPLGGSGRSAVPCPAVLCGLVRAVFPDRLPCQLLRGELRSRAARATKAPQLAGLRRLSPRVPMPDARCQMRAPRLRRGQRQVARSPSRLTVAPPRSKAIETVSATWTVAPRCPAGNPRPPHAEGGVAAPPPQAWWSSRISSPGGLRPCGSGAHSPCCPRPPRARRCPPPAADRGPCCRRPLRRPGSRRHRRVR